MENEKREISEKSKKYKDFIRQAIDEDLASGRSDHVHTRFPPEPNGYLHIGHAKAICINFGIAEDYGGKCNLRFDDTNPSKEEREFVDSIIDDVHWLGFDWKDRLFFASDYFKGLFELAVQLIEKGSAFVCDLTSDEIREYRGTLREPGKNSPYRDRTIEENLDLFRRMRASEFPNGARTLRAKIDMSSSNINMRDPVMYRILHSAHHRQGDKWCIYPSYDWAHGLEDSLEGITHSLCSLEFEDHRPLYDWFIDELGVYHPRQIEFARLNITNTVLSKRSLRGLVEGGYVDGWDDPRMPTLSGLRRRGYTPLSIREFCSRIGIAKADSLVDIALLEHCIRKELNITAKRFMAVLRPLKVIIDNYPEGKTEWFDAIDNPEDENSTIHKIPFSREIFIERKDFMEDPPKKYFRLSPGKEVRLKYAYYITCTGVVKDESGEVTEVHCEYDPESRGGGTPDGRRIKGTLHFVDAGYAKPCRVRLYDRLFTEENMGDIEEGKTAIDYINPDSCFVLDKCVAEPEIASLEVGERIQLLRHGYFVVDKDSKDDLKVLNMTVSLKDSWAKIQRRKS
ncbi:glutamine--tRNA ligase/YqeY domain fusion protein [bacterium]|nr:glutamine--tRNA ligase/YqeY domain fusion protein [bacterium]